MRVRVQNPFQHVALSPHMIQQRVSRPSGGCTGLFIKVQDRIDDCGAPGFWIRNDILDTKGALVEEPLDDWMSLQFQPHYRHSPIEIPNRQSDTKAILSQDVK